MTHSAGLHITSNEDAAILDPVDNVTQMLHHFKDEPLQFKPGTQFNYSNYGFQLLGGIVESITKKPFQNVMTEFMQKNGLHHSHCPNISMIIPDIARFYKPNPKSVKENMPSMTVDTALMVGGYWPAGALISNVDDLIKYGHLMIDSYKGKKNGMFKIFIL